MTKVLLALLLSLGFSTASYAQVRLKDLVDFEGMRGNDLVGYGLVVGLSGTGDGIRNSPFTEDIMTGILERLGVNVGGEAYRPRNVAAVIVTAVLPPFARSGTRIDVTVSAIGDASSLLGGTLVMTPLTGADGEIYAVSQGAVIAGGASVRGQSAEVIRGVPTAGTIPAGASVEREIDFEFTGLGSVRLALRNADFSTALRIEQAVNAHFGQQVAGMRDAGTVLIDLNRFGNSSPAHILAAIEGLIINPSTRARVIVDQRSGTIVMGESVRISAVAVSQGGLTLRVQEEPIAIQPNPFSDGQTVIVPRTVTSLDESAGTPLVEIGGGATLSELVSGLNALGVSPRDMIDILNAVHASGSLHAELVVR